MIKNATTNDPFSFNYVYNKTDKLFFSNKKVDYITKPLSLGALITVASKLLTYCKA